MHDLSEKMQPAARRASCVCCVTHCPAHEGLLALPPAFSLLTSHPQATARTNTTAAVGEGIGATQKKK